MILKIIYMFLVGSVRIKVEGFFIERFLNICRSQNIFIQDLQRKNSTYIILRILKDDFKKIKNIAKKTKCKIKIERKYGVQLEVITDYNGIGKLQYLFGQEKLPILDAEYTDIVTLKVLIPKHRVDAIIKAVTEATNGKAQIHQDEELYYAVLNGQVLIGDELESH